MKISKRAASVAIAAAAVIGSAGAVISAGSSSRSAGPDGIYLNSKTGSGGTVVTLHVRGVAAEAGRTFGAHVHVKPCGGTGAAAEGHYQHAGAGGSLEAREVWLDVTVNAAGNGHAVARRPWPLDESAPRSVILHADPTAADGSAGLRLACINLDGDA
jgi:Cu-Zn family superoxide dismutase